MAFCSVSVSSVVFKVPLVLVRSSFVAFHLSPVWLMVVAVVGHGHGLSKALCLIIDPAWPDRVYVAPILFFLRVDQRIAITFAGGSEEKLGSLGFGQTQGVMSPQGSNLEGLNG